MAGEALIHQFIIGFDRILQPDAACAQSFDRIVDVAAGHGQMLDAFAMILPDELFNLAVVVLAFVQRDADRMIRGDHGLTEQTGRLALDVEIFLLLEIEEGAVKFAPDAHLSPADIVGQVIEQVQADIILCLSFPPSGKFGPVGIQVFAIRHEIKVGTANALNDGIVFLGRFCPMIQRPSHRPSRVGDAKGHGAGRWPMFAAKRSDPACIVAVQHQVDATLFVAGDVLHRVPVRWHKAQLFELPGHGVRVGGCEFDKFKTVEAQWIGGRVGHDILFSSRRHIWLRPAHSLPRDRA